MDSERNNSDGSINHCREDMAMSFKLRPYQQDALDKLRATIGEGHRHILLGAPTGFGKTSLGKQIVDNAVDKGKRVLFTAHRKELIYQTFKTFGRPGATSVSLGQEGAFDKSLPIQLASLQTLAARLRNYGKDYLGQIDIVIMDEVHYGWGSAMQQLIMEAFGQEAIVIGLSATPVDALGYRLEGFDTTIYDTQTEDLIAGGYLTPVECFAPVKPNLDNVKIRQGDYAIEQIEKIMEDDFIVKNSFEVWQKYAHGLKTVVFCVSIAHAEMVEREFKQNGVRTGVIHSKVSKTQRDRTLEEFKNGEIEVLTNVDVLTTGFDEPTIQCLLLARPTKSMRLYLQIIGRGIRTHPSKEQCLILDCAGNIKDNGYPTSRRNFNRPKPLKGQKKQPEPIPQDPPECESCGNIINPEDRGRKIYETEDEIQTVFTCPSCGKEVKTIVVKKSDVELEAIEDPKAKKLKETVQYSKMTNQHGGYQELRKIAHQAGYKAGFAWINSKAITQHKLWPQAAQIFQRVQGMGLMPCEAINELREIITSRGEKWS